MRSFASANDTPPYPTPPAELAGARYRKVRERVGHPNWWHSTHISDSKSGLGGGGWGEVGGGDDLDAGRSYQLLVDKNDGGGAAVDIGNLGTDVGRDGGAGGNGSCGHHDDGVSAVGDVEVASIDSKAEVRNNRRDGGKLRTGGNKVDIHRADAGGLTDKTQGDLTRGGGLTLIREDRLLQVGEDVADEGGVLAASGESALCGGEHLGRTIRLGRDGVGAWSQWNVRSDGAETEVVDQSGVVLVDVQARSVRRGIDYAKLREYRTPDDTLATDRVTARRPAMANSRTRWTAARERTVSGCRRGLDAGRRWGIVFNMCYSTRF